MVHMKAVKIWHDCTDTWSTSHSEVFCASHGTKGIINALFHVKGHGKFYISTATTILEAIRAPPIITKLEGVNI